MGQSEQWNSIDARGNCPIEINAMKAELLATLARRERIAFECIRLGYTNNQIARYMEIKTRCAKQYVRRVLNKLKLNNRIELFYQYRLETLEEWISKNQCV